MPSRFRQKLSIISNRYRTHLLIRSSTFIYPDLGSAPAMRLISFTTSSRRSALEFDLVTFELGSLPPFTALSYTWGSPFPSDKAHEIWNEPNHLAFCNQQPIAIRKNLYDALQHIRTREHEPAWIWVDAVCINQADDEERTSQVEMMSDIYGTADLVLAWLGPEDEASRRAHTMLNTFGRGIFKMAAREGWDKVDQYGPKSPELVGELGHCLPQDADWSAWNEFFQRNWFRRAWILQEASLAKNLRLVSGQYVFDFDEIHALVAYSEHAPWWPMTAPNNSGEDLPSAVINPIALTRSMINGMLQRSRSVRILEDHHGSINQGMLLLLVLALARELSSSDPRDKVYGNLGIAKRILGVDFDDSALPPDYNIAVADLYIHTASYILTTTPILSLLSHIEDAGTPKPSTLPSWVPDLTVRHTTGRLRLGDTANIFEDDKPLYRTYLSGSSLTETRSVANIILFVNGHCLATVSEVATGDSLSTPEKFTSQINLLSRLPHMYLNGQSTFEAYWRTYMGDFARSSLPNASQDIPSSFIAMIIHGLLCWFDDCPIGDMRQQLEPILQHLANLDSNFSQHLRSLGVASLDLLIQDIPAFVSYCLDWDSRKNLRIALKEAAEFLYHFLRFGRLQLFRTENEYLGLGPRSSRPEDQVWIFEQARVPFILRAIPNSEHFHLVGECYVHGVMQGELVDKIQFKRIGLA
ncbi:heterokaryon incompatibility protein-domain-containing protein [Hyaloscypha finlandica]|nr:heterokaryon incompatibility protein-domain-containing protein [Hyaloscypha finlandica]